MLNIRVFELGPIMTNAYLVWHDQTRQGLVVDPGSEPNALGTAIEREKIKVEAILLTHAHFDHIGGVEEIRRMTGNPPVYLHQLEADWLTDPQKNGAMLFGAGQVKAKEADLLLTGEETLSIIGRKIQVMDTPGHSPGSVSYYFEQEEMLISGDVLFRDSIGRTDLPGGDAETLMASVRELVELPEAVRVLPGHGPETTIGREQELNPFVHGL